MMLSNILAVLAASITLTSAALLKPGVQFFNSKNWEHPEYSTTIVPEDGVCRQIPINFSGSMKVSHRNVRSGSSSHWEVMPQITLLKT